MKKGILMATACFCLIVAVILGWIKSDSFLATDDDGIVDWNSIVVEELV